MAVKAGNDREKALSELADEFGTGTGRAEALIAASRARYRGDLGKAQNLALDEEATEALDLAAVAKAADIPAKAITGASVRGDYVVYSFVADGRADKGVVEAKEVGKKAPAKKKAADSE